MSRNLCCVPGCPVINRSVEPLQKFPNPDKDLDRFNIWISRIGGEVTNLDKKFVYNNRSICRRHFVEVYHYPKNRLCTVAVPSLHMPLTGHQDIILETTKNTAQPSNDDDSASQTPLHEADDAETINDDDTAVAVDDYDELFDDEVPHLKTADPVKLESSKDVPEAERTVHSGFKCNSCLGEIAGFRYRCVQCADYDLCPRCESSAAHAAHYVLRVPRPAPPAEVRGVLAAVRLALRLPPAADLGPEVKEEPDCVDLAEEVHEAPETADSRVDPLELDAVNQNELEYSSETEPRPETTEPPAKKHRPIILKHVQKTPRLDPGTLGHRSKPDTLNAAGAPVVRRNYLNRSTLHALQPDPLKPNVYKLLIKKPVTNTPKPVAGQPEARRPILVSPRGSTAAAASGGAGGLPIVRLSRLPDRLTRAQLGR